MKHQVKNKLEQHLNTKKTSVAIVGGGPGGLFTALRLQQMAPDFDVTLFEASARPGGKIISARFAGTGVSYEAGAAELYDYSHLGPDPLKELILDLGLSIASMEGPAVVFESRVLQCEADLRAHFGADGYRQLQAFTRAARKACTPAEYYESDWSVDATDRNSTLTFSAYLSTVTHPAVRRYIETVVHSDLAVENEHTSALYGLQNWLMNEVDYLRLYYVCGGIEQLITRLTAQLQTVLRLQTKVQRIGCSADGGYLLTSLHGGQLHTARYDAVVTAVPVNQLTQIVWDDPVLAGAIRAHRNHYDHPAHYLRITLVFKQPFWRAHLPGHFFMLDAFGGCCVYDESARDPQCTHGVLGWLLAGDAALVHANLDDAELVTLALASLPDCARAPADAVLESAVHRWAGGVNGWPMGNPIQPPLQRHRPAGDAHPGFMLVGDYLFDSTLNGVLDSAELVAETLSDWKLESTTNATAGSVL